MAAAIVVHPPTVDTEVRTQFSTTLRVIGYGKSNKEDEGSDLGFKNCPIRGVAATGRDDKLHADNRAW